MKTNLFSDCSALTESFTQKRTKLTYIPNESAPQVVRNLSKDIRLIGLTRGQFSLIDLIYAILKKIGRSNVICVTWSAGIKDANTVKWMLDTDLIESFLLITDHSYVTRQKKYAVQLTDLFGKDKIRTSEIHAKFVLIWNDDSYITIRTSMNLNANRTCESFELDEGKQIFDFYHNFVTEVFGAMPPGFSASSALANRGLDRTFQKLSNQFFWQNNE